MSGDACASCELCTLKRRVAVLEGDLVAARTAAAAPPPPAISKVAMLPLRDAAVTALMHDAVMAQAPHLIPEHFHVLQHDSNVPVVKRFLAGVSKATQGQLTTVEDVLRCGMRTILPAQNAERRSGRARRSRRALTEDTHGVARPDAVAHFIGFHGTKSVEALRDILTNGFDPSRRSGQALGRGEYFGRDPTIAAGYDSLQCITVNLLLHVPAVITNRADTSQVVVMDNPTNRSETFCLPIGLYGLQAEVYMAEAEKWRPESLLSEQARIHKAEQAAMAKAVAEQQRQLHAEQAAKAAAAAACASTTGGSSAYEEYGNGLFGLAGLFGDGGGEGDSDDDDALFGLVDLFEGSSVQQTRQPAVAVETTVDEADDEFGLHTLFEDRDVQEQAEAASRAELPFSAISDDDADVFDHRRRGAANCDEDDVVEMQSCRSRSMGAADDDDDGAQPPLPAKAFVTSTFRQRLQQVRQCVVSTMWREGSK
jgi:hypothetical protein